MFMGMLKGSTIQLYTLSDSTEDEFGVKSGETYTAEDVGNVIIGVPTDEEALQDIQLYGKRAVYTLAIPVGDSHDWTERIVGFNGKFYHTIGEPQSYDENVLRMLPTAVPWNLKVRVVPYEGTVTVDE